ncbi:Hypothetical protein PHPALM_20053, partial [Phytophthora palmivora]
GACAAESQSAVAVAKDFKVHRSTVYRWKAKKTLATAKAKTPNKCYTTLQTQQKKYVRFPELESRLIDWIAEMRREKSR